MSLKTKYHNSKVSQHLIPNIAKQFIVSIKNIKIQILFNDICKYAISLILISK